MGVKNLWDILESCKQTLPLHHLQNKRLCVDLSCWIIQLQNANRSPHCIKDKLYLKSLFHRVRALIALNCSLVFVADGSIPSIKLSTYRRRLGLVLEETNPETAQPLRRNMGSEFSCMIKEAKVLGLALGIPCLDGIEEAEAQCASLNSASLCDGCFTSDSDIFLFGARTVYRDIFLGVGGYVTCYEMVDIERKLGFGRNSLITLALLLGSDYSHGVHGFGPETACHIVKSIGDNIVLHQIMSEGLIFARKAKGTKTAKILNNGANKENDQFDKQCKIGNVKNPGSKDQFLQVINAYLNPKCHIPDSEAVQRVCVQHPFLRTKLQQICAKYFGWSPDQTDQYILPKFAERDLRRFANLRAKSSELGARIPLHKMPVPCPVAAIVKPRQVQKREYFEVSWHKVDGLQTYVIPADLVESACPEKIAEFMEKKEEMKKQNRRPRPRKSTKAAVNEVDLQLQGLLLSIESESDTLCNPSKDEHSACLGTGPQSNCLDTVNSCHLTDLDNFEPEIIDLSTPSPSLRECKVAKSHNNIEQHVHVINLSESETDTSPEHERKARELRLFIESIREDLY